MNTLTDVQKERARVISAAHYIRNREKIIARGTVWRKENPEKYKAIKARWRASHQEEEKARRVAYNAANPGRWKNRDKVKMKAYKATWNAVNREKEKTRQAAYRAANRGKIKEQQSAWYESNKDKVNAKNARREATLLRATPSWANHFFIVEAYDLAQRRSKATHFTWHVDHIVPLRSKRVCGLHVENNLRVIPATNNIAKGNRHWPDMP